MSDPDNTGPVNPDGSRGGWGKNGFRWESGEEYIFESWMQPVFNTDGNYVHFWKGHGGYGTTDMLATNEIPPNAPWREGKGIAEIPLTLSITQSATPKEGAGTFTTSLNLSAGSSTNLANVSTVYWKVTGISNDDLASGDLTGYGTITDGKLDVQHSLVVESDSGESFEMSVYSDSGRSQQIGATYSIEIQELESIEAVQVQTIEVQEAQNIDAVQAQTIEVEQAQNIDTVQIETTNINRLYNSSSNSYLFSSNQTEIDILTGQPEWVNEGVAYSSPEVGTAQVYRFHLTQENRHFYTANNEERNHIISSPAFSSWSHEGIAFNVFSQEEKPQSAIPVVRYFNANYNSHLYSSSVFEQDLLNSSLDWVNEGTAWHSQSI